MFKSKITIFKDDTLDNQNIDINLLLQIALANVEAIKELKETTQNQVESIERLERLALINEQDRKVIWEGLKILSVEINKELAEIKAMRRDQSKLIEQLVYNKLLE